MKKIFTICCLVVLVSACEEDLEFPSTTQPTTDNYYNTAEEVYGATGILYGRPWLDWFDKAFTSVGDVLAGTVTGVQGNPQYNSFYNFNITPTDGLVGDTWRSCYKAAGQASVLIQTFEEKRTQIGDQDFLTIGIAEARFIRAFAYFYIARTFGDVPIVENPLALTEPGQSLVPRYFQDDVLQFALDDLAFAEANLLETPYQTGRVTPYSAKGMMAKIYLYMQDYENARIKAKEVIDYANASGLIGLDPDPLSMFTSTSHANSTIEDLFSFRWELAADWNGGNRYMTYAGPQALYGPSPASSTFGFSAFVPSFDMLDQATGFAAGDLRRTWSVMEDGYFNPDWVNGSYPNGFTYDVSGPTNLVTTRTGTRSSVLKYCVAPEEVNFAVHSSMPTFLLRYADVLLIYAEAIMGGSGSTADGEAVAAFNAVHERAGLAPVSSITIDELLHERKVEFAFEGDYWFDIQRQGFAIASTMVSAQERGVLDDDDNLQSFNATMTADNLFLPIPSSEVILNPLLADEPVSYSSN